MDPKQRQTGIAILGTAIKQSKNCVSFEKYIWKHASKIEEDMQEEMYFWFAYQVVGLVLMNANKQLKPLLKAVKKGKVGWKSPSYDDVTARLDEHDDYLVTPFEVVEGVVDCPKCGGSKTWSVQKQTRSSDEPMTTFSCCVTCGHKWRYSG